MADAVESYYLRFWKRFRKDAAPWARDNILWGIVVLIVPPLAVYLRDPHAQIDWGVIKSALLLYASTFAIYIVLHLRRTARKLDEDREVNEQLLTSKIAEQEETIRKITSKPQRTPAEQHHYDMAKKALQKLVPETALALRHLKMTCSPDSARN
jgi:hypothetical protein